MDNLEEQISNLADEHLHDTSGPPDELLRRLGRALSRKTKRVRTLEDGLAHASNTLQKLASTGDADERSSLVDSLTSACLC